MKDEPKNKIQQEVFDLYDDYAHSRINRRNFMEQLATYAVGGITLASLLSSFTPDYQESIQVKADDPRIQSQDITYASPQGGGQIKALLCMPKGTVKPLSGIVIIHENRGLNPHIADVARRAAVAGFIVLAPDALSPLGGYPGNDDAGRELQSKRSRDEMLQDFIAGVRYLQQHPLSNKKVGAMGFCFGGWVANMLAVQVADLAAAVPFYGGQAPIDEVPKIQAPLMLHFAEHDPNVNAGWPAYEIALKAANKEFKAFEYPGVNHGFHNDSTARYDRAAAQLAWQRSMDFLKEKTA